MTDKHKEAPWVKEAVNKGLGYGEEKMKPTEHVHEWDFNKDIGSFRCKHPNCKAGIGLFVAADRLNEYETLKAATEMLSAKQAKGIAWILYDNGDDELGDAATAYANILEGKDE